MAVNIEEKTDEFGNPLLLLTDPDKTKVDYSVAKSRDGYAFYEVRISKGTVPKELSSFFTNQKDAEQAVLFYLSKLSKSYTVKRDDIRKARDEQKKEMEEK